MVQSWIISDLRAQQAWSGWRVKEGNLSQIKRKQKGSQVVGEGAVGDSEGSCFPQPFIYRRRLEGCGTTPCTNAPQRRCVAIVGWGERQTRWGRGMGVVGCQVITAITRQGSVTISHICPPHPYLSGDRRGGDPDLPVPTDCGHYRERALQPIRGCAGLLGRKTKSPSHYFLLTMIPTAWRREWHQ